MKIGVSLNPYGKGYARFGQMKFSKIAQHGFSSVDYNIANTETELYSLCNSDLEKKIREEKTEANRTGIAISQVHGPWRYPPQDSMIELRKERMKKMKRSILITNMLGCKYWVVHPIMPCGTNDLNTGDSQKTWNLNKEFMSELLDFAKSCDVTICLENMPMRNLPLANPTQILKFVKSINDDHFKICLDTGHAAVFPGSSVGDAVRELGEEIKVLHVHDNMGDRDSHLYPTKGIIDWVDFINALKVINFNGVFLLETEPSTELDDKDYEFANIELYSIAKKLVQKALL